MSLSGFIAGVQGKSLKVKSVTFATGSSTLSVEAKLAIKSWRSDFVVASKILVTGYAPKFGKQAKQISLAKNRASNVVAYMRTKGFTGKATIRTAVVQVSRAHQTEANKATVIVISKNPQPKTSPSSQTSPSPTVTSTAQPTISPSVLPSVSPSPIASEKSQYLFSGTLKLDFVYCNNDPQTFSRQVLGTSLILTSTSSPTSSYTLPLDSQATSTDSASNNQNCLISWNDFQIPSDTYKLTLNALCATSQSSAADFDAATACRPSAYFDRGGSVQLSGIGPTTLENGYSMSLNFPSEIVITGNKTDSYYAWVN